MWAVRLDYDEQGQRVYEHVVPFLVAGDHYEMKLEHTLTLDCTCEPLVDDNSEYTTVVIHHDPDHPGAMSEAEWNFRRVSPSPLEAAWYS
jgi:predicted MPP superfamily phosphohydrolase